jgi:hypothetical protein
MRTLSKLYPTKPTIYTSEVEDCPECGQSLKKVNYWNGLKTVQTMGEALTIAYRPKRCVTVGCQGQEVLWPSASWQRVAPKYSIYGYDVIAQIGWERQKGEAHFETIHSHLRERMWISESQVRYLYNQSYLALLACHEREHLRELEILARQGGLLLDLDGLMPEGGEAQLWCVRELRTGWTLRSGWMNRQDTTAFVEFLQPIAALGLPVKALMSDKQRALLDAIAIVFPDAKHSFCQFHYLDNAAEPIAAADEQMKIELRQGVRSAVGDLIRPKKAENAAIPVVTGLLPSPVPAISTPTTPLDPEKLAEQERENIVQDLLIRVRYLLTLKGRPPFRLAGIEMFARLQEVTICLEELIEHSPEPRLVQLLSGLRIALAESSSDYQELSQAAQWLKDLADILDPEGKPKRTGKQVRAEWMACLARIKAEAQGLPHLQEFSAKICKVSASYAPGLFFTYDIPGLPRTNNGQESGFRQLRHRLLSTTGQLGATKRLLLRSGAWELIPGLPSLDETHAALSHVPNDQFLEERRRVRIHRAPFRLHTRSVKQSDRELKKITQRWKALPPSHGP